MRESRLSTKSAFFYFSFGAWGFVACAMIWGYATGNEIGGPMKGEWWQKAIVEGVMIIAAIVPAAFLGMVYAAWLRMRQFSTRWREARVVPIASGVSALYVFGTLYAAVMSAFPAFGLFPDPVAGYLTNYAYLAVIPITLVILAEASV